jgi:hypothetical protein
VNSFRPGNVFYAPSYLGCSQANLEISIDQFALPRESDRSPCFHSISDFTITIQLSALKEVLSVHFRDDSSCAELSRVISVYLDLAKIDRAELTCSPDLYSSVTEIFKGIEFSATKDDRNLVSIHGPLLRLLMLLWPYCRISLPRMQFSMSSANYLHAVSGRLPAYEFRFPLRSTFWVEATTTTMTIGCDPGIVLIEIGSNPMKFGAFEMQAHELVAIVPRMYCFGRLEIARRKRFESICEPDDGCFEDLNDAAAAIEGSFELLNLVWHEAWQEVSYFVRALIPLETDRDNYWRSGSDADVRFAIRATVKRQSLAGTAENVLHEAMHCKLYSLLGAVRLYYNSNELLFRHPWRPDPRPFRGVLLGAHAFLAVAEFYRRLYLLNPDVYQFALGQWRTTVGQVEFAMDQLRGGGQFTDCGATFFSMLEDDYAQVCQGLPSKKSFSKDRFSMVAPKSVR